MSNAQNNSKMTQKDTLRHAADLLTSGLKVYNHNDCNNDLNDRRVGAVVCSDIAHAYKIYGGEYRVFQFDKSVGTYKTAFGAARKLSELNRRKTAFFAQDEITEKFTFLTDCPVYDY